VGRFTKAFPLSVRSGVAALYQAQTSSKIAISSIGMVSGLAISSGRDLGSLVVSVVNSRSCVLITDMCNIA
jgi:hypothetical protein